MPDRQHNPLGSGHNDRERSSRTHEKVVGIGIGAADLEELHQVMELPVDITADGYGAFLVEPV